MAAAVFLMHMLLSTHVFSLSFHNLIRTLHYCQPYQNPHAGATEATGLLQLLPLQVIYTLEGSLSLLVEPQYHEIHL